MSEQDKPLSAAEIESMKRGAYWALLHSSNGEDPPAYTIGAASPVWMGRVYICEAGPARWCAIDCAGGVGIYHADSGPEERPWRKADNLSARLLIQEEAWIDLTRLAGSAHRLLAHLRAITPPAVDLDSIRRDTDFALTVRANGEIPPACTIGTSPPVWMGRINLCATDPDRWCAVDSGGNVVVYYPDAPGGGRWCKADQQPARYLIQETAWNDLARLAGEARALQLDARIRARGTGEGGGG